jgi:hypothetical protein
LDVKQPKRPTSTLARRTWPLRSPAAALVLLGLFGWIACEVPRFSSWVAPQGPRAQRRNVHGLADVLVVRDPSKGFALIDPEEASWERLSGTMTQRPEDVLQVMYESTVERHGFWFPMIESGEHRVLIKPLQLLQLHPFSEGELREARVVYLAWLAKEGGSPELANELRGGDQPVSRVVPSGVLMNLVSVAVLGMLVLSLIGMPRYLRVARARRRLREGVCGLCRYDLGGIVATPEGKRCPECGSLWEPDW